MMLHLLSFQWLPDGAPFAWFSCVGIQPKKENDNDAKCNRRDCLAESETTSTSATLGANQAGFGNRSLSDSGTCFHLSRLVLDRHVEFRNSFRWSSRVASPLLMVRHFAKPEARFLVLTFFPFSVFPMASWLHCSLAPVVKK